MHSMLNQFFSMIYFFPLRNRSSACSCTICSQTGRFGWTTHPSSSQSKIGRQVVLPVKKLVFCAKELYSPFMFSIHKKESNPPPHRLMTISHHIIVTLVKAHLYTQCMLA